MPNTHTNAIKIHNKNEKVLQNLTKHLPSSSHHGHGKKGRRKKKQKVIKK